MSSTEQLHGVTDAGRDTRRLRVLRRSLTAVAALATCVVMVGSGATTAEASTGAKADVTCEGGGSAPPGKETQFLANTSIAGHPGYYQNYYLSNTGSTNARIAFLGFRANGQRFWKSVPLSAGGDFAGRIYWGNILAAPAIKVLSLDQLAGASAHFDC